MRSLRAALRLALALTWTALLFPLALASRVPWHLDRERSRHRALVSGVRVQTLWCRGCVRILGLDLELVPGADGREAPPAGCHLVVSNHLSYLDILVLGSLFPGRFVAKSEIAGWPLFGQISRSVGTLFLVQRDRRDLVRVGEEMERTLRAGVGVVLFPEGEATRGARVERFSSALLAGPAKREIPCLAVALSYETPGEPWAPAVTACWWGGMNLWAHIWRLLGMRAVRARVGWAAEPLVLSDRKALSSDLEAQVRALFRPVQQAPLPPGFEGIGAPNP